MYNGIVPDSSILYPDFIRGYYPSLTLNRIMSRLIRMFIRVITYLSVRSLNLRILRTVTSQIWIWHGYLSEFILRFRNRRDSSNDAGESVPPFKLALTTNFYPNQNRRLTRTIYYRIFIRILLGWQCWDFVWNIIRICSEKKIIV